MRAAVVAVIAMLPTMAVQAADLAVLVSAKGGTVPVADAVIEVRGDGDASATFVPATRAIDQRNETFVPYVEIFRPGDRVEFRNSDSTRHHVYSFSAAKSFEFVIAPGEHAPAVTLEHTGEIDVGCNIHDHMIAHLFVTDAAHVARTGPGGQVVFTGLAEGRYTVRVWHPQLRPGRDAPQQTVQVGAAGESLQFSLALLPDPRAGAHDPERGDY